MKLEKKNGSLTSSTVVVHVDDGVVGLVHEEGWAVETVLGVEDALLVDWVEHSGLALKAEAVESVQAGSHADLDVLGWNDFAGESDKDLLFEDVELEW